MHLIATSILLIAVTSSPSQSVPVSPERAWERPPGTQLVVPTRSTPAFAPDQSKIYTLSELVNLAEQNNPETRVAWENARARAAELGISEATLYPTLAAAAVAQTSRYDVLFSPLFYRQTVETFSPTFSLDYTIFDFGKRLQDVAISRSDLLAANFLFNDTHRKIIFLVMQAYYRLLNSKGQESAEEANLKNAQTVQESAEARLQEGLSTLPDVLEARSAAAQADYDLQAAIGATEIAHGDLATALGISPTIQFQVESIQDLTIPEELPNTVEQSIDRALAQRPDLMQRVAQLRAARSEIKAARTDYLPTLSVNGSAGLARSYGEQDQSHGVYAPTQETWSAKLSLNWTLFDGFARENRIAKAKADQKQAAAEVDAARDQVENDVWSAYSTARTALRQQKAAAALLAAASESYNAALQSYNYGVRSQIDVVSAQRALAVARTADVSARTQLLTGIAALAFQTGDLLHAKRP
ncbi:TolC family protein [Granulicella sp. S190]|uniref:TolC family protein n=1 Tax=Granulicella sp. S190 TaxID=1747226 RepID=UPI0020B1478B|nr:TolC family protein [Granulicella sp. S190]